MNLPRPSPDPGRKPRGSTLIEMSVVMLATLAIASASLALISQQVSFTRMLRNQAFLLEEAPMINNLLSPMLGRVDSYRIYPDVAGAKAGGAGVTTNGNALLLSFRNSINQFEYAILAAEDQGDGTERLGYYYYRSGAWGSQPDWVLSNIVANVTFYIENGVLRVQLTGRTGEQITYSGHTQS